ncbi:MAG: hypothetical protein H0X24_13665 [Ktedonobacterales bacterium]|nr:hypothetical protein [Ktedonobacterales bacterium]
MANTDEIREDPHTGINWHRHPRGCPHYRERWLPDTNVWQGEPMYQVFCLQDTPPVTAEEQAKCLVSHNACWRITEGRKRAAAAAAQSAEAQSQSDASA